MARVALDAYSDPTTRQNFIAQGNLIWEVSTGPLAHKMLFGIEYGDQKTANKRVILPSGTTISLNLANPVFPSITLNRLSRDTRSDVEFFSAYGQDQISFGDHFDVVVGLRYDHFEITGTDFIPNPDRPFARTDDKLSPRMGLIWKPVENASIYASYSQSFLPRAGDQFVSLTATQQNLAPEKFTNREIGAKWDIRPDLNVTLALFQLDRTNATTPDPANPLATINIGKTRTRGVELALTGHITPEWQVSTGYSWQDGHLRGNDSVASWVRCQSTSSRFWNRYDVSERIGSWSWRYPSVAASSLRSAFRHQLYQL